MHVLNFTTDERENDDGTIDGLVCLEGREIFRAREIGWIYSEETRATHVIRLFANRLAEVLQ